MENDTQITVFYRTNGEGDTHLVPSDKLARFDFLCDIFNQSSEDVMTSEEAGELLDYEFGLYIVEGELGSIPFKVEKNIWLTHFESL